MARKTLRTHITHSLLPVPGNGHHPHLLKREVIIGVLSVALLIEVVVLAQGLFFFKSANNLASVLPAVVTDLTNTERTQNGEGTLSMNPLLQQAAQEKADDMAAKGYFSHVSPDGTLPWHWFSAVGYNYQYAGENLAVDFNDSDQVVKAWMASPTHRANILKGQFTEIGVGMANGTYEGHPTIFVVQFFAKPSSGKVATPVATAEQTPTPKASNPVANIAGSLGSLASQVAQPAKEISTTTVAPNVLGAETEAPVASLQEHVLASPFTTSTYVFAGVAAFFVLLLVAALIFRRRLPRFTATISGLLLIVVLFGIVILNRQYFSGQVTVDNSTTHANIEK